MELRNSHSINKAVETALDIAVSMAHEYIMPEHLLMGLIQQEPFKLALQKSRVDYNKLHARLTKYLKDQDKKFGKYQVPGTKRMHHSQEIQERIRRRERIHCGTRQSAGLYGCLYT